jgi:hypothetical protein
VSTDRCRLTSIILNSEGPVGGCGCKEACPKAVPGKRAGIEAKARGVGRRCAVPGHLHVEPSLRLSIKLERPVPGIAVTTEAGILLLDVLNRLIEVERLSVGPDKFALLGIELHVLHQITEGVG